MKIDYTELTPETVIAAVEVCGYDCSGRMLALNSYENRVYRLDIEESSPVIAKFYRPDRWTNAAIAEEHEFASMLAEREIPVVAPIQFAKISRKNYFHQTGEILNRKTQTNAKIVKFVKRSFWISSVLK